MNQILFLKGFVRSTQSINFVISDLKTVVIFELSVSNNLKKQWFKLGINIWDGVWGGI
jgi:hypothetical protein